VRIKRKIEPQPGKTWLLKTYGENLQVVGRPGQNDLIRKIKEGKYD